MYLPIYSLIDYFMSIYVMKQLKEYKCKKATVGIWNLKWNECIIIYHAIFINK